MYELVLFFFFPVLPVAQLVQAIISVIVVELICDHLALLALQSTNDVFRVSYNSTVND